jgi:hypothetical protein
MKGINKFGHTALTAVQHVGLLIIALATVIAIGFEIAAMVGTNTVTLTDLLLFIHLEVLAMVAIYLDSGQLPVRIPPLHSDSCAGALSDSGYEESGYLAHARDRRRGAPDCACGPGDTLRPAPLSICETRW